MTLRASREPTHKFYVDDSGTKEYAAPGSYSTKGGVTPYFAFGGLLLTPDEAGLASSGMRMLKRFYFGTPNVEVKANWLRFPGKREDRYLRKFNITSEWLDEFEDRVYLLVEALKCKLIAAIVVKEQVQTMYAERAFYAPALAYECLIQRVQMEMAGCNGIAHVTIDDMDGATPAGKQYRDNLEKHHTRMRTRGSMLQPGMVMDRIAGLSFADSRADERLQIADLVTYSVYRQFVENPTAWDDPSAKSLPTYKSLGRILPKFRNNDGVVAGYGIVKFPTISSSNRDGGTRG